MRSRMPIGGAPAVDPASCDAGHTYPLVDRTVTRKACVISAGPERFIVANQPGEDREARGVGRRPRLGPSIVAVHVENRAAVGLPAAGVAFQRVAPVSNSSQWSRSTISMWRSPLDPPPMTPPSM